MSDEYTNLPALLLDAGRALTQLAAVLARRDALEDRLASASAPTWGELRQLQVLDSAVIAQHAVAQTLVNQANEQLLNSKRYLAGVARVAGVKAREEVVQ